MVLYSLEMSMPRLPSMAILIKQLCCTKKKKRKKEKEKKEDLDYYLVFHLCIFVVVVVLLLFIGLESLDPSKPDLFILIN